VAYETGRLVRIGFAGTVAALAALWLTPAWPSWLSLLAHGSITVAVYGALLWSTGFFRRTEIRLLREVVTRLRQQIPGATPQEPS
jgi:hypothetical protein